MGTKKVMSDSFERSVNFMIRFHRSFQLAKVKANVKEVYYYPVMDGIYIASKDVDTIKSILTQFYLIVTNEFLDKKKVWHKFVIRGVIAYGEVFHGEDITKEICPEFDDEIKNNLLIGMPMIQAIQSEHSCPPFGVYIHESARKKALGFQGKYFYWYQSKDKEFVKKIKESTKVYFDWCKEFHSYLEMEENKIEEYKHLVDEFFCNLKDGQIVEE